jgi:hypothetical protein
MSLDYLIPLILFGILIAIAIWWNLIGVNSTKYTEKTIKKPNFPGERKL